MQFVGRRRETRRILQCLSASRSGHLVITGRFGMGRTRLLEHVASVTREQWHFIFVDFQQTAARAASQLVARLPRPVGVQGRAPAYTTYRRARYQISCDGASNPGASPVVVLDDLGKVTRPRLRFLEHLVTAGGYSVVVVVDDSVVEEDVMRVRSVLQSAPVLHIERLPAADCAEFFHLIGRRFGLAWSGERVDALVRATGGYPLAMVDAALRAAGKGGLIRAERSMS